MIYYDDPIVFKLDPKIFYLSDQSESQNDLSHNNSQIKKQVIKFENSNK